MCTIHEEWQFKGAQEPSKKAPTGQSQNNLTNKALDYIPKNKISMSS